MTIRPAVKRRVQNRPTGVRNKTAYRNLPATNVIESGEAFLIEMAVPGLNREDIKIDLEKGVLTIRGEQELDELEYTRREFDYSRFVRDFILPETVDAEKISATCKNGVLTLRLEKFEDKKKRGPQRIEVQ